MLESAAQMCSYFAHNMIFSVKAWLDSAVSKMFAFEILLFQATVWWSCAN